MPSWLIVSLIVVAILAHVVRAFAMSVSYKLLVEGHTLAVLNMRCEELGVEEFDIDAIELPANIGGRVWIKLILKPWQPERTFGRVRHLRTGDYHVFYMIPRFWHFDMSSSVTSKLQLKKHQTFVVDFTEKAPESFRGRRLYLDQNGLHLSEEI